MSEYIRILESEVPEAKASPVEARIAQLTEAERLIEAAIQNEDGAQDTMQEIISVLHREYDRVGEDDFHFKRQKKIGPINKRMKLGEEKKMVYVKMLAAIRRERDRLEEGGALAGSHNVVQMFREQRKRLEDLKASLRNQPWWTQQTVSAKARRARVRALIASIDERMLRSRKLATALIQKLTAEVEGVGLPGPWTYRRIPGSYPIRFEVYRLLPGGQQGEKYDKAFLGHSYVEELVQKLNNGQYLRNVARVPFENEL